MRVVAVVPVKPLAEAKSRLRGALPAATRRLLVLAMLSDLLAACSAADVAAPTAVITPDAVVARRARRLGAVPVREPAAEGLDAAARRAAGWARSRRADALLLLSGDLPLVTPDELRVLLATARQAEVVIGGDLRGTGTNALLLRPPGRIATAYGPGSRRAHREAAARAGATCAELVLPGLARDVDTPEDVQRLAREAAARDGGVRSAGAQARPRGADTLRLLRLWMAPAGALGAAARARDDAAATGDAQGSYRERHNP